MIIKYTEQNKTKELKVDKVIEIMSDDKTLIIEPGGWGAGIKITLPPSQDILGVTRDKNNNLIVRIGY